MWQGFSLACVSCSNGQWTMHMGEGLRISWKKKEIVLGIMLITFICTARLLAVIWTNEFPSDTLLWALNHCAHPTDFNTVNNPS